MNSRSSLRRLAIFAVVCTVIAGYGCAVKTVNEGNSSERHAVRGEAPGGIQIPQEFFDYIGCIEEGLLAINDEFFKKWCGPGHFNVREADLNDDGNNEIIVDSRGNPGWSGSGGYSTWILLKQIDRYIVIGDLFGGEVAVSTSRTEGYSDLIQKYKDYSPEYGPVSRERRIQWNGEEYVALNEDE